MEFKVTAKDVKDGQPVVQVYEFSSLDLIGAEHRAYRLDGSDKKIEAVGHPELKYDLSEVKSWKSGLAEAPAKAAAPAAAPAADSSPAKPQAKG